MSCEACGTSQNGVTGPGTFNVLFRIRLGKFSFALLYFACRGTAPAGHTRCSSEIALNQPTPSCSPQHTRLSARCWPLDELPAKQAGRQIDKDRESVVCGADQGE